MEEVSPTHPPTSLPPLPTFLTETQRHTLGHNVPQSVPHADTINNLYSQLNGHILSLDKKVGKVLQKHEIEILQAYKEKMYKVQKELRMLKDKANEEENVRRKQQKIDLLMKESEEVRSRAEVLDRVCRDYKKGVETWKSKTQALEDDLTFLDEQIGNAKKQNVRLNDQLRYLTEVQETSGLDEQEITPEESDNIQLNLQTDNTTQLQSTSIGNESSEQPYWTTTEQSSIAKKIDNSSLINMKPENENENEIRLEDLQDYSLQSQASNPRFNSTISHLQNQLESEKRTLKKLKWTHNNYSVKKGQFEELFQQCVDGVKEEIQTRRQKTMRFNYGSPRNLRSDRRGINLKPNPNFPQKAIRLTDFTEADKRSVMQQFMSDVGVRRFLYEQIFGGGEEESMS